MLRLQGADAIEFTLQGIPVKFAEGQGEEGPAACFDACQGRVEGSGDDRFFPLHLGGIFQSPMGLQRRPEVNRAGFAGGLVADGDDNVRWIGFERVVAFAFIYMVIRIYGFPYE